MVVYTSKEQTNDILKSTTEYQKYYAKYKKPGEIGHIIQVGNEEEPDNKNKKQRKKRNPEKWHMEESISRKEEALSNTFRN